jgi:hypothetical protein
MIGTQAILAYVAFPFALGLFFLCSAAWSLHQDRLRKPANVFNKNDVDHTNTLQFMLFFSLVWLAYFANRTQRELHFHSDLSLLRPETVERIEIGNRTVTDKRQIAEIIAVINYPEWFSLQRGDGADAVPFLIKLADGRQYSYTIRRYLHGEGAALVSQTAGWDNGEVLCRRLPASLAKAGVTLPPCSTYFGKPQTCVTQ